MLTRKVGRKRKKKFIEERMNIEFGSKTLCRVCVDVFNEERSGSNLQDT